MSHPNSLGWDELKPYDWLSWIGYFSTQPWWVGMKKLFYQTHALHSFTIKFAISPIIGLYGKNESLF